MILVLTPLPAAAQQSGERILPALVQERLLKNLLTAFVSGFKFKFRHSMRRSLLFQP